MHLALADGRGHLVRAMRLRALLRPAGIEIEIATTSDAGARFLRELGVPSWVLPGGLRMICDARHGMDRGTLDRGLARYLAQGLAPDILALRARRADAYINDSFHPALLAGDLADVVLVHGDTMEQAFFAHFDGTALESPYRHAMTALLGRARARVHHAVLPCADHAGAIVLPPLLAPIVRSEAEVRRRIGARDGTPIACVYLNPHYRDESIARALESALGARFHLHAVGEGFAGRPGWRATDGELHEVIARASVLVSGAGMATIAEARRSGVPLLVLQGDQPEQAQNLARAARAFAPGALAHVRIADGDDAVLGDAIVAALDRLAIGASRPDAPATDSARLWRDVFVELLEPSPTGASTPWNRQRRSFSRPTTSAGEKTKVPSPRSAASSRDSAPRPTRSRAFASW